MKKLFIYISIFLFNLSLSQQNINKIPYSFSNFVPEISEKILPPIDVDVLLEEDINSSSNTPFRYGKKIPAIIEFVPLDKEGNKTIVERLVWKFDIDINERFFLPNYMKNLR